MSLNLPHNFKYSKSMNKVNIKPSEHINNKQINT